MPWENLGQTCGNMGLKRKARKTSLLKNLVAVL